MRLVHVPQCAVGRRACIRVQASKGKTVRFVPKPSAPNTVKQLQRSGSSSNILAEPLQAPAQPPVEPAGDFAAWQSLPARYKMLATVSMAFIVCAMDKVNISVAIIPMAQEYGWNASTAGLIQSAFFFGYMLSQIPGGWLSSKIGGRWVLPAGVGLWSAATAGVPLLASTLPGLFVSRAAVGLGEGVAPAAATDIVARTIDKSERGRATSFIFGGLHIGSLIGLLAAPPLIEVHCGCAAPKLVLPKKKLCYPKTVFPCDARLHSPSPGVWLAVGVLSVWRRRLAVGVGVGAPNASAGSAGSSPCALPHPAHRRPVCPHHWR